MQSLKPTRPTRFFQARKVEVTGLFADDVAHDLCNQLTVIKCWADVLRHRGLLREKGLDYVQRILEAADRSAALTEELLALSYHLQINPGVVNLAGVIADGLTPLKRIFEGDISLEIVPCPELGNVLVDSQQLQWALMNLTLDAAGAMAHGGRLTIQCSNVFLDESTAQEVPEALPGDYVLVSLTAFGHGMDVHILAQTFESLLTPRPTGAAAGSEPSMVCKFLKEWGGTVSVQSEPGKGTTVKMCFPRVTDAV